jgi:hypothetical protein
VETVVLPGQLMVGGRVSRTVTVNEQVAVPATLEAVQVTTVAPSGKRLPGGGLQVTIGVGFPLALGTG